MFLTPSFLFFISFFLFFSLGFSFFLFYYSDLYFYSSLLVLSLLLSLFCCFLFVYFYFLLAALSLLLVAYFWLPNLCCLLLLIYFLLFASLCLLFFSSCLFPFSLTYYTCLCTFVDFNITPKIMKNYIVSCCFILFAQIFFKFLNEIDKYIYYCLSSRNLIYTFLLKVSHLQASPTKFLILLINKKRAITN